MGFSSFLNSSAICLSTSTISQETLTILRQLYQNNNILREEIVVKKTKGPQFLMLSKIL